MSKKSLNFVEWYILFFYLMIVATCIFLSYMQVASLETLEDSQGICIYVEGAVKIEGKHFFKKGVLLEEVLEKISLKDEADLKLLKWPKRFYSSTSLYIPKKRRVVASNKLKETLSKISLD